MFGTSIYVCIYNMLGGWPVTPVEDMWEKEVSPAEEERAKVKAGPASCWLRSQQSTQARAINRYLKVT